MKDDTPVFQLDLSDPRNPKARRARAADLSATERLHAEARSQDPAWRASMQKLREVVARGPASVVLVDEALPEGAIARVIVDPSAAEPRLLVVSKANFDDAIFARARHLLLSYELATKSRARAEVTLWPDGRARMLRGGEVRNVREDVKVFRNKDRGIAKAITERALALKPVEVKGVGTARVIDMRGHDTSR
jgi:hypothetical protein